MTFVPVFPTVCNGTMKNRTRSGVLRVMSEDFAMGRESELLAGIVGLDGFGLDDAGGVALLPVLGLGGDSAGDVAAGEGYHATAGDKHCGGEEEKLLHGSALRLAVLLVVLVGAEVPEVLVERLVARLLLRLEVSDVGGDEAEVLLTQLHSAADCTETSACQGLVGGDRRLARDGR